MENLVGSRRFSRRSIIAAADILKSLGHSGFDRLLLEFGLSDPSVGRGGGGLLARATSLAQFAIQRAGEKTEDGTPLDEAIITRAAKEEVRYQPGAFTNVTKDERERFRAAVANDGFSIDPDGNVVPAVAAIRGESIATQPDIRTPKETVSSAPEPTGSRADVARTSFEAARRIFIVHGQDEGARETVARYVEGLGFQALILHELPNRGRTIITKFREEASDAGFAIVLMTPDDFGGKAGSSPRARARQNVIFELGFFIGALGPERVAALTKKDVERPSDFDGVIYILLEESDWKIRLARELEAAGYKIDWAKVGKGEIAAS